MELRRLPTNSPIDKILGGGLECGAVTNIFGPPGSGKTNIALTTLLGCKNKIVYIDTEGSFSPERFHQLGGDERTLKRIELVEPHTWLEQNQAVARLVTEMKKEKIDLVIVDSLVALYRLEISDENFKEVNRQLATQYSILSKIAREYDIPVLVTNQVYSKIASPQNGQAICQEDERHGPDEVELTSRTVARYWSKCLIELRRKDRLGIRTAILRKHRSLPEGKSIDFEITAKGLKEVKLGIF
jgi:DNA repair protein RadB